MFRAWIKVGSRNGTPATGVPYADVVLSRLWQAG
jgi:hypothetical protein